MKNALLLKQLQALEKDCATFEDQVSRLGDIVKRHVHPCRSGKAQWALKWLLRKFSQKDEAGTQARGSVEAWKLLRSLIDIVPVTAVAQALQQHSFLVTVSATFQQCRHESLTTSSDGVTDETQGLKRKAVEQRSKPAKRRKTTDEVVLVLDSSPQKSARLLQAIVYVLERLRKASSHEQGSETIASQDYLRAVLKADHEVARDMLLAGARAITCNLIDIEGDLSLCSANVTECLATVLSFWEGKKVSAGLGLDICKDPISVQAQSWLLVGVAAAQRRILQPVCDSTHRERLLSFINTAEYFVAKHSIIPVKLAFQTHERNEQIELAKFTHAKSKWRFSLFSKANATSLSTNEALETASNEIEVRLFAQSNSALLRCALKCSNLHSPKKRSESMPWIKSLFTHALAALEEIDLSSGGFHEIRRDETVRVLEAAATQEVTFEDARLCEHLLELANVKQSPASQDGDSRVHWDLVVKVVKLFPTFVVPSQPSRPGLDERINIFNPILARITSDLWFEDLLEETDEGQSRPLRTYRFVKDNLVSALIEAFKAARAHIEFLSAWHEQLCVVHAKKQHHENLPINYGHLFEDPDVALQIATKLIPTMPQSQTLAAIESLTVDEPPGPAFTVLWSLLLGQSEEELTLHSTQHVEDIVKRSSKLCCSDATIREKPVFWRVLAIAARTWITLVSGSSLQQMLETPQDSSLSIHLKPILTKVEEMWRDATKLAIPSKQERSLRTLTAVEALACTGALLASLDKRHVAFESSTQFSDLLSRIWSALKTVVEKGSHDPALTALSNLLNKQPSLASRLVPLLKLELASNGASVRTSTIQSRKVDEAKIVSQVDVLRHDQLHRHEPQNVHTNLQKHEESQELSAALDRLSPGSRLKVLYETLPADTNASDGHNWRWFNLVAQARTDWAMHTDISPMLLALSHRIALEESFTTFETCAASTIHLLQLKNARPTQHAVESIVAALTTVLSVSAMKLHQRHCRKIYFRLCRILQTLLARNTLRRRLRGRMQLLLPPLQALLRCLFVATSRSPSLRIQHPPWLDRPIISSHAALDGAEGETLNASSAAPLSRIITSLADPPLSAVSSASASRNKPSADDERHTGTEHLTDPTAQARTYMSHFAPLLLGEYANCLLKGRFCADGVREALQPGIWALLDIQQRNGMGIDALGSVTGRAESAREVLRTVVSDWRRATGATPR